MAIEIVPKEKIKRLTKESILFYLSLFLFIFSIALFLFFTYSQKEGLKTLQELEAALVQQKTREEVELSQKISEAKKKTEAISLLLSSHKKGTNFFNLLEKLTHPEVSFNKFILETEEGMVSLTGRTESFKALGQQTSALEEEELIEEVNLVYIKMGKEKEIEFLISLLLDPEIWKYK